MDLSNKIRNLFSFADPHLLEEVLTEAKFQEIPSGTTILRAEQYVKVIPLVISGVIKVFTSSGEKELLLYYIRSGESCVMSFASGLKNEPSKVFALTEEDTVVLLMPVDKVAVWSKIYPELNTLFFQQFNLRYADLLETINHVLFDKLDQRVYEYLKSKAAITGKKALKIPHKNIAADLGTAREVVSRILKKLESEKRIALVNNEIEIL
ncbi:MAG: Crp/Fnr family transcriptional regulator [Lentimicrobium sp.]|nr:Crp/Fnr family transcriptional regulator [Lentimicrobium sp.]